jgi:hypothetical protein
MLRKTVMVGFFLFAYTKFCYGEINIIKLEDGTEFRVITTRVANGKNKDSTLNGNRPEEAPNYSYRNGYGPSVYLSPNVGYPPPNGYDPHHRRRHHHEHKFERGYMPFTDYDPYSIYPSYIDDSDFYPDRR